MSESHARSSQSSRVRELIKGSGLRCTPARQAVLGFLSRTGRPLAHSEIAKARGPAKLDRVTLYRTLAVLEDSGLVHRVQDSDGSWRFCAHVPVKKGCPGNHAHFQCTRCGEMQCLASQALPWIPVPDGALVIGKQFLICGLCPSCAATRAARKK